MNITTVKLSDEKMQIIPECVKLLNPDKEGKRKCAYFVWFLDPDKPNEPAGFDDTISGNGVAGMYLYFTDFPDLYKTGRHDTPVLRYRFESLKEDFKELLDLMIDEAKSAIPAGKSWAIAYMLCDCMGGEVPVGASYAFVPIGKEDGDER